MMEYYLQKSSQQTHQDHAEAAHVDALLFCGLLVQGQPIAILDQ